MKVSQQRRDMVEFPCRVDEPRCSVLNTLKRCRILPSSNLAEMIATGASTASGSYAGWYAPRKLAIEDLVMLMAGPRLTRSALRFVE